MKKLNEILGTEFPIIQGGMANIATGEFAAACSNAGALGMIATGGWDGDRLRREIRRAKELTDKPFGVNLMLMSPYADDIAQIILDEGVKVALGSDIAGGDHLDLFDVTAAAIRASKARRMMDDWSTPFLTVAEGWYLATSAGEEFFGEQPGFAAGNSLHAIVLADDTLPQPRTLTPAERLERAVYRRQEGAVQAVWSAGRKIYAKP